jgi:hypothetical protein
VAATSATRLPSACASTISSSERVPGCVAIRRRESLHRACRPCESGSGCVR